MITYGDVELPLATAEVAEWAAKHLPLDAWAPWHRAAWPGYDLQRTAWPRSGSAPPPPRPGLTCWPTGASRWACSFQVADTGALRAIAPLAWGADGTALNPLELALDAGYEATGGAERLAADFYLVRAIPLSGVPAPGEDEYAGVGALWLLVLADERWYWRDRRISAATRGLFADPGAPPSWADLAAALAADLGIELPAPEAPADYARPHASIAVQGAPAAVAMDALARNLGMRFLRKYDGSCELLDWTAARARRLASLQVDWRAPVAGSTHFEAP